MKTKLFVGVPCYGGLLHSATALGLMQLIILKEQLELELYIFTITNESLITRGRNEIAGRFLASDCTHLFFLDADVGFDPRNVKKLIDLDVDVAAGTYPMKVIDYEGLLVSVKAGLIETEADAKAALFRFPSGAFCGDGESVINKVGTYAAQCTRVPTGFMVIKRETLEKLKSSCTPYTNPKDNFSPRWNFFNTEVVSQEKENETDDGFRFVGEDYSFCDRVNGAGMETWLDVSCVCDHYGTLRFEGMSAVHDLMLRASSRAMASDIINGVVFEGDK